MRARAALALACLSASPILAATPRASLTHAAFNVRDKATALADIKNAEAAALLILARAPADREAQKMRAMAVGYRAKLAGSRSDALLARKLFDALVASDPRDAEAQAALGSWHIDAVSQLGGFMAGTVLGANRNAGLAALDRSIALGGKRAFYTGLAALLRAKLNPADPQARTLAEAAIAAPAPTALDQFVKDAAAALLVPLRAGNLKSAQAVATLWLPLGHITR